MINLVFDTEEHVLSFQRFCLLKNLLDILCAHNYLVCSYAVRRMNGSIQIEFKSKINPGNIWVPIFYSK